MSASGSSGAEPERYELQSWLAEELLMDRRAFLRTLGGGLLVLSLIGRRAPAQWSGKARDTSELPADIGTWLHVAPDGAVTAYTGKVEMGQNARTSLTQAVAEELHVAPGSVKMVMGDTARTPRDIGTFGSLTTPVMFLHLRRAAAAARESLVELAARRWEVETVSLVAVAGRVEHPPTGRALDYGTLARGQELVRTISEDTPLANPADWKVAGHSLPKVDARAFVTGAHRYASDLARPDMLHGKVLRPPSFGATLSSLDTSAAEALPGVTVHRDGEFVGVVAPDEATAERALAALRAEWNEQPVKCSDREVPEYLRANVAEAGGEPVREASGSASESLKKSDVKVEQTYTCAYIAHVPLEPRACIAHWQGGELTVWTGTQVPFGVRSALARTFEVPEERVRVIVSDIGGGYGGKHTADVEIEAARLARAAGQPVRRAWTRTEEFTWAYYRPAGVVEAAAGARKDGTLTAWSFRNINSGTAGLPTPYDVPDRLVEFRRSVSPLRQGSYRALASTFNHFARESLMDELAHALGLDPLVFRLRNTTDERLRAAFRAAADRFGWSKARARPGRGVGVGAGIAGGAEKGCCIATCAEVRVDRESGRVRVERIVTAFDPGAVVNPGQMLNQVEGATMMGLGGALFEAIRFEAGQIRNASLARYRVPRFGDLPRIDVVLLDRKDVPPAGAGEIPIVAVAPALANAIFDATGARLRALPLAPDGVPMDQAQAGV